MTDDWIQAYQILQTIGNSEELCGGIGSIYFIRNMSTKESINTLFPNIVNFYLNRSSKTASYYILLFEHGRRLNSTVSNLVNNRIFRKNAAIILKVSISYPIWAWRSRDSIINSGIPNIVNWQRNWSAKTESSYISLFEYGRRLNSTVSNHANNKKFGRMLRWFWQYLFHMQYEHEGVEIAISVLGS